MDLLFFVLGLYKEHERAMPNSQIACYFMYKPNYAHLLTDK